MAEILYNPVYEEYFTNESHYAVIFGSAGSGKSHAVAQKHVERCTRNKEKFLVIRKFKTTLESSVFTLIKDIISDFGISQHVSINNTKMSFTFSNGSEIITSGLDDVDKLKSIHGITSVWCEEATELEESDLKQLDLRLRGVTTTYRQITLSFNPVSIDHWIYKRFFEVKHPHAYTLKTTYKDNLFLDEEYKRVLEEEYLYDDNMYRIYVLGEWGRIRTFSEFYSSFSKDRNVKSVTYNPSCNIHMSWDFNVNPYLPISLWQIREEDGLYNVECFDIITMENPRNNTEDACKEFMRLYPNPDLGIYVYGDASGRARQTTSKVHNYDIIEDFLKRYLRNWSWRVPSRNPFYNKRRDFVNKCLGGGYEDIQVTIGSHCELMIADLENVLEDMDGRKHKKTKKNAAGVLYEPYGHLSDTMDYVLCSAFESKYRDFGRKISQII